MTVEADIHVALMARAEQMVSGLSLTALWPRMGGDQPSGEHVRIYHVPGENEAADLNSQVMDRQGILHIMLVSDLDGYEAPVRERVGQIVSYFDRGSVLSQGDTSLTIMRHSTGAGSQQGGRWETPIRISYRSLS